jgi:hypothetical protein
MSPPRRRRDVRHVGNFEPGVAVHGIVDHVDRVAAHDHITLWPSATVDALTGESRSEPRQVGTIQEEPFGFIHSWSPKADAPLVLLQANISQEGVPEIIFVK